MTGERERERESKLTPFVQWVGGKKQHLKTIKSILPKFYNRIIEPFVGGGVVFLNLKKDKAIINDINSELITAYKIIKEKPRLLIEKFKEYQKNHSRDFYNSLKKEKPSDEIERATKFIYQNRACYNGLYRVNRKGEFNVAYGNKEEIRYNFDNILAISDYLNNNQIEIKNNDYKELLNLIKEGDFLFVDPPYCSQFNGYDKQGKFNQEELLIFLKECDKKGVKWLLTNNNSENIRKLFKDYNFTITKANSVINSDINGRKNQREEIFITNYSD